MRLLIGITVFLIAMVESPFSKTAFFTNKAKNIAGRKTDMDIKNYINLISLVVIFSSLSLIVGLFIFRTTNLYLVFALLILNIIWSGRGLTINLATYRDENAVLEERKFAKEQEDIRANDKETLRLAKEARQIEEAKIAAEYQKEMERIIAEEKLETLNNNKKKVLVTKKKSKPKNLETGDKKAGFFHSGVYCPSCRSLNVQFMQNKRKNFSVGKAIGGAFLTGGIGTLAGFAGKQGKKNQWFCQNCGRTFIRK